MRKHTIAVMLFLVLTITGFAAKTILRLPSISQAPKIDGTIMTKEWIGGTSIFGGISQTTGLLALRDITFYIAYDSKGIYLGQKSDLPPKPMTLMTTGKMADDDTIKFILRQPGTKKEFCVEVNSKGKGKLPPGVRCANQRFGIETASI
jgi:hypothetical protein